MEAVSARLIDQWEPLTLYFQSYLLGENTAASNILQTLQDPRAKLFFLFLSYILPVVNLINVTFQSEKVRIHNFLETVRRGLRQIMSNFIQASVLGRKDPFELDHRYPNYFKSLNEVYLGAKAEEMMHPDSGQDWRSERDIENMRKQALSFYVELCSQIKSRINHKDDLIINLRCIDPLIARSGSIPSMVPIYMKFRQTIRLDIELVDQEWRSLAHNGDIYERFEEYRKEKEKDDLSSKKKRKPPPLRVIEDVPSEKEIRQQRRIQRLDDFGNPFYRFYIIFFLIEDV